MRAKLGIAVAMMALVVGGRPGRAQQPDSLFGQLVVSIAFEVEGRPETSPDIAALADIADGQPLRRRDVTQTITHLDSLGRYDQVSVAATPTAGGVAVLVRLVPRHPITRFEVRSETPFPTDLLAAEIRQRYDGIPTNTRLSAVEASATQFLNDQGYPAASVRAAIELSHAPDEAALVLVVQPGPVSLVRSAVVQGTSPLSTTDVLARAGVRVGQPFRRRTIEAGLAAIEEELHARGYYEAQVTLQAASPADGVDLTVTVEAGRLVELRVVPAGIVPGRLDDLIPVRRLGSVDQDLLEDSRARIEGVLKAQGYWRASAPFARVVDPATGRLVITFTVTRGPRFYVERINLPSNLSLPSETIRTLLGVEPGSLFDASIVEQGLARVRDAYRQSGFYRVQATPSYEARGEEPDAERATVVLHPNIVEGPRGIVSAVSFTIGAGSPLPEATLRSAMRSIPGAPYVQTEVQRDRVTLERLYQDRGFRTARVQIQVAQSADGREQALAVDVTPGPQIRIGQISIVGNGRVSTEAIRETLRLAVGEPASDQAINDARSRLVTMGVFRRARIESVDQFTAPDTHLIVNVVEADANTLAFGGGVEGGRIARRVEGEGLDDVLEFAPRGTLEASRRYIGGRDRTASFFSRLSLKRRPDAPDAPATGGGFGFAEYRVTGSLRERRAFQTDTDLLFAVSSEQARRTGFNFIRQSVAAEAYRSLGPQLSLSARYNLDFTRLFDEQIPETERSVIDRVFPEVRLSTVSLGADWDRRDNLLTPSRGTYLSADLEGAFRALASEVGYAKAFVRASGYRRADEAGRTVLAGRVELGLAAGFERTAFVLDEDGQPVETVVVDDLPASKRFFAGGGTTVRGFQLDRLAVSELINANGFPTGGNALIVANAEVRRAVTRLFGRNLGAVAFIDAGNVFRRANDFDVARLRSASGVGVRYDTPLGLLRLDFGIKHRPVVVNGTPERRWEYHLSIGEAF